MIEMPKKRVVHETKEYEFKIKWKFPEGICPSEKCYDPEAMNDKEKARQADEYAIGYDFC
jgi:hypothetical protein